MKVINLWAGPGAGKSTTAAGVFRLLKLLGLRAELVTEYAKDLHYEEDWKTLDDQKAVFLEQTRRQQRLVDKVDYAVTDSPLPLSVLYAKPPLDHPDFGKEVMDTYHSFDNMNFLIERVKPYQQYGRSQDEIGARLLDARTWELLSRHAIPFKRIKGNRTAPQEIVKAVFNEKSWTGRI